MVDFPASHVSFRWMYIVVATKIRGTKRINPIGDPFVQEKWPWSKERSQCEGLEEFSSLARLLRYPVPSSSADDESQLITHPSSCSIDFRGVLVCGPPTKLHSFKDQLVRRNMNRHI